MDFFSSSSLFISNRMEALFEALCNSLRQHPGGVFSERWLVVSSQAVRQWLTFRLAQSQHLGIASGLRITFVEAALSSLLHRCMDQERVVPQGAELAMRIEGELRLLWEQESAGITDLWAPVWAMVGLGSGAPWSALSHRKLSHLASHLANLFSRYGVYGGKWRQEWERAEATEWQAALWQRLFLGEGSWTCLGQGLEAVLESPLHVPPESLQLHLFGLHFLSASEYAFFERVGHVIPCHFYVMSPCQLFWEDLVSDREKKRIHDFWDKRGASSEQMAELELYLRDRNPLLANFGRLGREYHRLLQDSQIEPQVAYFLPRAAMTHSAYEERLLPECRAEDRKEELTLLDALQADMLLLRNPDREEPIAFDGYDGSVEVHQAVSPLREVEILHDRLLAWIHHRQDSESPLTCGEILVMAPQIMDYEPYIRTVFAKEKSPLPYQILDAEVEAQSRYYQAFLSLLDLAIGRWEVATFLDWLEHPYVQKRFSFSLEDERVIRRWILESGVKWGLHHNHRNEALKREGCDSPLVEKSDCASWSEALKRLLWSLAVQWDREAEESLLHYQHLPLAGVEGTQGELLGTLVNIVESLERDLAPMHDGSERTLREWGGYLRGVVDSYLQVPSDDGSGQRDRELFYQQLLDLEQTKGKLAEMTFPFTALLHHLKSSWREESRVIHEQIAGAVRFCSLLPMRSIPARVIWLLGMDEGSFPRRDGGGSLNYLFSAKGADYCPSRGDYDRYLFLESLLSARERFAISYQGFSWKDGRELNPSLLVRELMHYMKGAFTFDGQHFGEGRGWIKHPFWAHDERYFQAGSPFPRSYSHEAYGLAFTRRAGSHLRRRFFSQPFASDICFAEVPPSVVSVREITDWVTNPLNHYLKHRLGMRLVREDRVESQEPLAVSFLAKSRLRKQLLASSPEEVVHGMDRQGGLPWGLFKNAALRLLTQELEGVEAFLSQSGVNKQEILQIQFERNLTEPTPLAPGIIGVPSLGVRLDSGAELILEGRLPQVSPQGLLVLGKNSTESVWKAWPLYLIFAEAIRRYHLDWAPSLLFLRDRKILTWSDFPVEKALGSWLSFFVRASTLPCPLLPSWISEWEKGKWESIKKKMELDLSGKSFKAFYNESAKWVWDDEDLGWSPQWVSHWQEQLMEIWTPVREKWKS